jgi:hypothetical protein
MLKSLLQFSISICCVLFPDLLYSQSVGGTTSGAKEYCEKTNSGFISVTGYTGTILDWEVSTDGGATWTGTGTNVANKSYYNLSSTTCYRAVVRNGTFAIDHSSVSCVVINAPSVAGTIQGGGLFCDSTGAGVLHLKQYTGAVLFWKYSTNGGVGWNRINAMSADLNYSSSLKDVFYKAFVQNGPSCKIDSSGESRFLVSSSVAGSVSGGTIVCPDSNKGILNLSGNKGDPLWLSSSDNGHTWASTSQKLNAFTYVNLKKSTLFRALVQNGSCRSDTSAIVTVAVYPTIAVYVGKDTAVTEGSVFQLKGSGKGIPEWEPANGLSDKGIFNPFIHPLQSAVYILNVHDDKGCVNSDTILVEVIAMVRWHKRYLGDTESSFVPF